MRTIFSLILVCFVYLEGFAQELILNEVCAKNTLSYTNTNSETPDWFEIKNVSQTTVNLSDYSIALKSMPNISWQLPQISLAKNQIYFFETDENAISVAQWETIVDLGKEFSYIVPSEPISNWTASDFDDTGWGIGSTPIGYGETNIVSSVPTGSQSVFMRTTFSIDDVSDVAQMVLHMDFDDGFIAYINGTEVARSNMGNDSYNSYASNYSEGVIVNNVTPPSFTIENPQSILHQGTNTFCVQVHNNSATSSDLLAIPILSIGHSTTKANRQPVSAYATFSTKNAAPFAFKSSSDVLYLLKNQQVVDSIAWEDIPTDVTIGRETGDYQTAYYFAAPTPNLENTTQQYVAKTLSKPKLNRDGGAYYKKKFYVAGYTTNNNATLRYTTNGAVPTISSPISPDSIYIGTSTNLRIRAFREGYIPSETTTATYLILPRIPQLPIASITVQKEDFFDYNTGIYVEGPNAESAEPHFGANYWQDWEKPAHFEYFTPKEGCVISQDVGVKIGGNWSRALPQKTLKLYARSEYGSNEMKYQFFKDKPIDAFHIIVLRNSGNDFNNTQMRDGVISILAKQLNIDRQAYQPAIVFINGVYYGIQNVREKINASYVAENYGYNKDDIDFIKNNGEVSNGTTNDFYAMRNYIENTDLSDSANYQKTFKYLDIDNFIDYNVLEMYVVNQDWPGNNTCYWHSRSANTPWRYMLFDADFGLGVWDDGKVNQNMLTYCTVPNSDNYANAPWSTAILRSLLNNETFKRDFMNHTADRLNTTLSADSVIYVIDSIQTLINPELLYHTIRWNTSFSDMNWNVEQMRSFARNRELVMRTQTEEFFATNGSYTLSLALSDNNAGKIHLNSIDVTKFPWSGKYFNNNQIFLTAIPNSGYTFVRWEGTVSSTEPNITITTDQATNLTAVFEYVGNEPNIVFTEVYYNTLQNTETEWLEIHNNSNFAVDMSNWSIRFDKYDQTFTIPSGTVIEANKFMTFANDSTAMRALHPDISIVGNLNIDFAKNKAVVTLRDSNNYPITSLTYSDQPLPRKADGYGYSYEYIAELDSWRAPSLGGTPGIANNEGPSSDAHQKNPVINEINYASAETIDADDWIEIYNPDNNEYDLSGWVMADKSGNIAIFPENGECTIPSGGYLVVVKNAEKFHQIHPNVACVQLDISLNSYIDGINLYDKYEFLRDSVYYSMFEKNWTKYAFGTGSTLSLHSTEDDNAVAKNWLTSKYYGTPGAANDFKLSIPTTTEMLNVKISPNPCSDYVIVEIPGEFSYEIISSDGSTVKSGNGFGAQTIPMQNLANGVYLIVTTQNSIHHISEIVKSGK